MAQTLAQLKPGQRAKVVDVVGEASLQQRILEMGLLPGVEVKLIRIAPLGDPMEFELIGYRLSLRRTEAACVSVEGA